MMKLLYVVIQLRKVTSCGDLVPSAHDLLRHSVGHHIPGLGIHVAVDRSDQARTSRRVVELLLLWSWSLAARGFCLRRLGISDQIPPNMLQTSGTRHRCSSGNSAGQTLPSECWGSAVLGVVMAGSQPRRRACHLLSR